MIYKFFDKESSDEAIKNEIMSIKELVEKLHKTIIRKFENKNLQLISKFNREFRFLS